MHEYVRTVFVEPCFQSFHTGSTRLKVIPSDKGSQDGADAYLQEGSPQPDTSLHCKTMDTEPIHWAVCMLIPRFCWYSLHVPKKGWPGCIDLDGWLYIQMIYPPADSCPFKY